jgi:hypothetical protein
MRNSRFISVFIGFTLSFYAAAALNTGAALPPADAYSSAAFVQDAGVRSSGTGVPQDGAAPDADTEDAAPPQTSARGLLLQISNPYAVRDGEKLALTSGFGAPLAPYYDGSHSMVPLRFIAESFGYSVTWEESAQTAWSRLIFSPRITRPKTELVIGTSARTVPTKEVGESRTP